MKKIYQLSIKKIILAFKIGTTSEWKYRPKQFSQWNQELFA